MRNTVLDRDRCHRLSEGEPLLLVEQKRTFSSSMVFKKCPVRARIGIVSAELGESSFLLNQRIGPVVQLKRSRATTLSCEET